MQKKKLWYWSIDRISKIKPFLVAISFSPWLILLYLYISAYTKNLDLKDLTIIQNFIEWFGTAYSLFLALVLVNVWNHYDTIDREFDREVDAIATLYQTANYAQVYDDSRKTKLDELNSITEKIEKYLRHVILNYQNEHLYLQQRRNGEEILEGIGENISSIAFKKVVTESLITELFRSLNEARDVRGDRISHSQQRVPQTIWIVAVISSLVWLLPFFGLNIIDPFVSVTLIGGVTFVIVIVLIIINDFDSPFDGTWKIGLESWSDFLEIFTPIPRIVFVFKNGNKLNDFLSRTSIGRRFSLPVCKLSSLSREGLFGISWNYFIKGIQRHHPKNGEEIKCDVLYSDDFIKQGYKLNLKAENLPIVLLIIGNELNTLIDNQEIITCSNLKNFEEVFNSKIRKYIPWF